MNAPCKVVSRQPSAFLSMKGQAEKWRGECIQQFAELEQVLDGILRELASLARPTAKVIAGLQIGPSFKHVRELTGVKGQFEAEGKAISVTLISWLIASNGVPT